MTNYNFVTVTNLTNGTTTCTQTFSYDSVATTVTGSIQITPQDKPKDKSGIVKPVKNRGAFSRKPVSGCKQYRVQSR